MCLKCCLTALYTTEFAFLFKNLQYGLSRSCNCHSFDLSGKLMCGKKGIETSEYEGLEPEREPPLCDKAGEFQFVSLSHSGRKLPEI